jgi:hypothetical protein
VAKVSALDTRPKTSECRVGAAWSHLVLGEAMVQIFIGRDSRGNLAASEEFASVSLGPGRCLSRQPLSKSEMLLTTSLFEDVPLPLDQLHKLEQHEK